MPRKELTNGSSGSVNVVVAAALAGVLKPVVLLNDDRCVGERDDEDDGGVFVGDDDAVAVAVDGS